MNTRQEQDYNKEQVKRECNAAIQHITRVDCLPAPLVSQETIAYSVIARLVLAYDLKLYPSASAD